MKLPKLKNFYLALLDRDYKEFVTTRCVTVGGAVTMNPVTGEITQPRQWHLLSASAALADTRLRQLTQHEGTVWVLRIPRELVPREHLKPVPNDANMWLCTQSFAVPHCGVEQFELAPEPAPPPLPRPQYRVLASRGRS